MSAGLVPPEGVRDDLLGAFLCAFGALQACLAFLAYGRFTLTFTWPSSCVDVCVRIFPFYRDTSPIGLELTLLHEVLFIMNYICNDPISK